MDARLPGQSVAPADHTHARAASGSVFLEALASEVYGGVPVAIDPDDAGAAGTAATVARSDHGHEWLTASAAALTKTATSGEGSSGDGARADHVHATSALPWGVMSPRFSSTSDSSAYATGATTDFAIASMVVDSARLYRVHLHSHLTVSAVSTVTVNFHVDGTATAEAYHAQVVAGSGGRFVNASWLWEPTSGTKNLDLRVVTTGGATMTFNAAAANARQFWVEDVGLR